MPVFWHLNLISETKQHEAEHMSRALFFYSNNTFTCFCSQIPKDFPPVDKMDRFWMQRKNTSDERIRIQATVTDILLNNIIHITVEDEPQFNETYIIELDDSEFQAERYALFTAHRFDLIDFLFPVTPPELSVADTPIQR